MNYGQCSKIENPSMANYQLVPEARSDLLNILNYISNDSVDSALNVHGRFLETFELLGANPNMGIFAMI